MDIVSVAPSSSNLSLSQIEAAVIGKYGSTEGNAVNGQFEQVASDASHQLRQLKRKGKR